MQKLKYEKFNNSNDVITIDLHNGYTVIAITGFNIEKVYTTTLFRVDLNGMFQVYLSECSKDKIDREELANEIRKITRYVWFTSEEVFYAFIQRACPLIYSQIDRWKLLTELKEYSREIRVAEK